METPPQASRRRSRLGCATAVASLDRHVICSVAARSSHAPAHAAPVQPLPWVCRRPPVGCSLCHQSLSLLFASLMPAAAADPCATLQGGLVREAAVGRRRRECCFAKDVGCPILASLQGAGRGFCFLVDRESRASITRHDPPRPCTVAVRAPVVPPSGAIRHRAASPQS